MKFEKALPLLRKGKQITTTKHNGEIVRYRMTEDSMQWYNEFAEAWYTSGYGLVEFLEKDWEEYKPLITATEAMQALVEGKKVKRNYWECYLQTHWDGTIQLRGLGNGKVMEDSITTNDLRMNDWEIIE